MHRDAEVPEECPSSCAHPFTYAASQHHVCTDVTTGVIVGHIYMGVSGKWFLLSSRFEQASLTVRTPTWMTIVKYANRRMPRVPYHHWRPKGGGADQASVTIIRG